MQLNEWTDAAGVTWSIGAGPADLARVKAVLRLDLARLVRGDLSGVKALLGKPARLCDVLFVLVADQAEAAGVDSEEFGRRLAAGNARGLLAGATALVYALAELLPDRRHRVKVRALAADWRKAWR